MPRLGGGVQREKADDWSYELKSKLLVSPLISPIVVPYIIPYITPLRSLDNGSYGLEGHIFFSDPVC